MNRRFLMGAVLALVAVAILAGVGISAYDAGVAQGMADSARVVVHDPAAAGAPSVAPYAYPYHGPWIRPWFLFPLFPILGFLAIFFLIRAIAWRPHRGWYDGSDGGPRGFDEWHRRAHEGETPKAE